MSFSRTRLTRVLGVCVALCLMAGVAACGGESDEAKIARAKEEGRREEAARQKTREAEAKTREIDKKLKKLEADARRDRRGKGPKSKDNASGSAPPASPNAGGSTSCGDGLSVNSVTTCTFARNVRDTYRDSGGASPIDVYSPARKQTFTMQCEGGVTTVCTGGNNAAVYFR